jgi:hypothetical protein
MRWPTGPMLVHAHDRGIDHLHRRIMTSVRLTGREGKTDWQAVGVHDRVNLARKAPSRATHILMIVVRDRRRICLMAWFGNQEANSGTIIATRSTALIYSSSRSPLNEA